MSCHKLSMQKISSQCEFSSVFLNARIVKMIYHKPHKQNVDLQLISSQ